MLIFLFILAYNITIANIYADSPAFTLVSVPSTGKASFKYFFYIYSTLIINKEKLQCRQ